MKHRAFFISEALPILALLRYTCKINMKTKNEHQNHIRLTKKCDTWCSFDRFYDKACNETEWTKRGRDSPEEVNVMLDEL